MVVGKLPLYQANSEVLGYFDYMATLYPVAMTEDQVAYFNAKDVDETLFEGYVDDSDHVLHGTYASAMAHGGILYRHLPISDIRD